MLEGCGTHTYIRPHHSVGTTFSSPRFVALFYLLSASPLLRTLPVKMSGIVAARMTVKVVDASMDMFTPPCSPNYVWGVCVVMVGSSC